jgi:RimJ/RimL family protein N-acetyltransferase
MSCTIPADEWPFHNITLTTRALTLRRPHYPDAEELWPLLQEEECARLYPLVYAKDPGDIADFEKVLSGTQSAAGKSVTYTIEHADTKKPLGWVVFYSFEEKPKSIECALFLRRLQRTEYVYDTMTAIYGRLFEKQEYERVDLRRGSKVMENGQGPNQLGFSLIGLLRL